MKYSWNGAKEDSWESLGQQEIKQVNSKGNQPWIFTGGTDAETEAPVLLLPDLKRQLTGKAPDAGKNWGQEEKGVTEDGSLDGIIDLIDMSLSRLWEIMTDRKVWSAAVPGVTKSQTRFSDWATTTIIYYCKLTICH